MNDVERELRDMLERKAGSVGGVAPRLPEAVRKRGRRRQAGTGAIGAFTVAAVALVSFAGLRSIDLGAGNTRVPGGNQSDRYEVFERTAAIETITITSPSDWYLVNQWPTGAQVATSTSSGTSCAVAVAPGEAEPQVEVCEGVPSPPQAPITDPSPVPMLLLSNADLGLGPSPCLDGGLDLAGNAAVLEVAVDIESVQGIETGTGPELPAWPVAFDEDTVSDGPCSQGHYVRFQVGPYPYIAWIGFGPEASEDVRRSLFDMANGMQIEDVDLQGPSDETPGYVIAGGENAAGPWRLELRPSTSEGPDANVDLHLIGAEGGGPGVADFTVPDATPIESGGGDPTFGVVTKEATGVELRLEEGTPPIPATLVPLPPTLAFPFDVFFASNPSDVPAQAVALGMSEPQQPPPPDEPPTPNEEGEPQLSEVIVTRGDGWRLVLEVTEENAGLLWFVEKGSDPYAPLPVQGLEPGQLGRWHISSAQDRLLLFGTVGDGAVSVAFEPDGAPAVTVGPVPLPIAGADAFGLLYDGTIQGETGAHPGGTLISYGSDGRELDRRRVSG